MLLVSIPLSTFAHVAVKPSEAGIGSWQTFTMGVPNEKDSPTVSLRLVIPEGVESVSPNVKPGWTITEKKKGTAEDAKVTEISWTNGSIPAGQRDDFVFSAHVPSKATTLKWKAYQTYKDGTIVSWDQEPSAEEKDDDSAPKGPYSETKVIDDLSNSSDTMKTQEKSSGQSSNAIAYAALALSVVAIGLSMKKTGNK